jgi:hypothetical protein
VRRVKDGRYARRVPNALCFRAIHHIIAIEEASVATAEIFAGVCGFTTRVEAHKNEDDQVVLHIESECQAIGRLAEQLTEVDPFREFTFRGKGPLTLQLGSKYCSHAACPVPTGIIKAIEVEAGLALPVDVTIKVSKDGA